jgi:pimeloyl-ACP methyl ester carboxylesterase
MDRPETRYVKSADFNIAYQVAGEGPFDLIYVPGWISNIEENWEVPEYAHFLRRLALFSRLILFDKRGTGLSDRVSNERLPTLEQRMDDVHAVLEAAGSERAVVFGASEGGNMSVLFAATYLSECARSCSPAPMRSGYGAPIIPGRPLKSSASARMSCSSASGLGRWTSPHSRQARSTIPPSCAASRPTSAAAPVPAQPSLSIG